MKGILIFLLLHIVLAKFPSKFEFGASTAAFQIEGAWLDDNKSMSAWDNIAHMKGKVANDTKPDIGPNSYYLYPEDISLMKEYGIKNYRMSIAWTRIVPRGTANSAINQKGINHYRKQFKDLLEAGITPYVTLYHNDMPAYLYIEGTGYTDTEFTKDFLYYAETCFKHFGDLVKYWFTFNEPWVLAVLSEYDAEEIKVKPYQIGYALLVTHAHTVKLYRDKYQKDQKGKIGWVVNTEMFFPKDPNKEEDVAAAERALAFQLDWFVEPLFTGDYPQILKDIVQDRLPRFTEEEKKLLIGSLDFFALNHYFTFLAEPAHTKGEGYYDDRNINTSFDPSWKKTDMEWSIVPEGFYRLIMYIHNKWLANTNLEFFVTENGAAIKEDSIDNIKLDNSRIEYLHDYISEIEKAISNGVNLTKYFIWSFLDNFEWGSGFSKRFGIIRVEYGEQPKRIAKASLKWFEGLIKDHR